MKILENIPIASLTTMRLGGPARFVIEIEKPEDVPEAYSFARERELPVFVLGGGANTLGHDEGFAGVLIMNKILGIKIDMQDDGSALVHAMGGEVWDDLVAATCERGLTGIEALSKIPGTVGAAPVQNIGAYGQDVSQVLESIEVFDTAGSTFKTLAAADLGFAYRKSILNSSESGRYFVLAATFKLRVGEMARPFYKSLEKYIADHNETDFAPAAIRRMVSAIRADKLPDPEFIPSAGSFFKNVYVDDARADELLAQGFPVYRGHDGNKINSGWLIEQAGLSGKVLHGFRVNEKAALVLINESATSYADLAAARQEIVDIVFGKFGFKLEQEPVEIL
ncbi:UDP-N-acetylmuramate dehydrogenase [Candidatus Saccharibacteria bacterium]|nr:UDP-N-acetylmuramate dehydrogenase [Candidatus Saccharibacteria bacterium]